VRRVFLFLSIFLAIQLYSQTDMQEAYYNVSVTGSVEFPGVYHLPPTSRLSEAVMISRGLLNNDFKLAELESADIENNLTEEDIILKNSEQYTSPEIEDYDISLRRIILKRKGENIPIDLQRFLILGDSSQNPFLMDGDVIYVPVLTKKVSLFGEINNPGDYEILEGDRISDLIDFSLGLKESAYLEQVEIIRYNDNQELITSSIDLNLVLSDPSNEENILLENGDRIYIRAIPDFQQYDEVVIRGEVKFPGTYIISENTTLSQLIERAGNFTENADLTNSFLQRKDLEDKYDPEFERLKYNQTIAMTYFEYEYFKIKIKELKGKFSFDFNNMDKSEVQGDKIVLQDGDFVYISKNINAVVVSGQVKDPGLITFVPGKTLNYYIEQAGGLGWKAHKRKIRIIRADSGEWLKPEKDLVIYEGDTILVPYRPDWNYWEIFKDTIVVLSQIATLYLVMQSVK